MDGLVAFGGEVKDLGGGKVGGYLVMFGSPTQTDLTGDYFTKDTDFGVEWETDGTGGSSAVYYAHALDPVVGKRRLETKGATLRRDDVGVWIEAQLKQRDDYERAIAAMAAKGKLGWSSGTALHLVEKQPIKDSGAFEITYWALGLDASLTPRPAEPRCVAVPLKSLNLPTLKSLMYPDDQTGAQITADLTMATVSRLHDRLYSRLYDILRNDPRPIVERMTDLRALLAEYGETTANVVEAIFSGLSPQSQADAANAAKAMIGRISDEKPATEMTTKKADVSALDTARLALQRELYRADHEITSLVGAN